MMKKRLCAVLLSMVLLLSACAFPSKYPIEKVENILMVGVDVSNSQIQLTVVVDDINRQSEPGKEQIGEKIYTSFGDTIFEAKRNMHTFSSKRLSWYHLKYILIGEEAAKTGLDKVLDFFCENDENRFLHRLIVSRGMSASNFILATVTHDNSIADSLDSLMEESKNSGRSDEVHLLDYASACEAGSSIHIPTVQLQPAIDHFPSLTEETGDTPAYVTQLEGFALFQDNKLTGYLNGPQSISLNMVINRLKSTSLTVMDDKGSPVSLEVISSKAKIITDTQNGLTVTIRIIMLDSFMVEYHEKQDVLDDDYISYLEKRQCEYVENSIRDTLKTAQQYGTDVFGIIEALCHSNHSYAEKIKDHWSEIFSALNIGIEVDTKIQCTYSMINAAGN